jgi:mannitol/fructose-specific phosphotransferase system IIA component (Ntr-type)
MKLSIAPHLAVSKLLSRATIELSLRSNERDAVFAELIGKIPDLVKRPEARQALLSALQEREKLCSTGFGGGVALPHTRKSIPGLEHAVVVFGRHLKGIPYGAMDDAPVRLLFLLVAPTINQHLHILARLSRLLRNAPLRQDLLDVEGPEEVLVFLREAEQFIDAKPFHG